MTASNKILMIDCLQSRNFLYAYTQYVLLCALSIDFSYLIYILEVNFCCMGTTTTVSLLYFLDGYELDPFENRGLIIGEMVPPAIAWCGKKENSVRKRIIMGVYKRKNFQACLLIFIEIGRMLWMGLPCRTWLYREVCLWWEEVTNFMQMVHPSSKGNLGPSSFGVTIDEQGIIVVIPWTGQHWEFQVSRNPLY